MLYADKHPKSLEETVYKELKNVCEWQYKKSNIVVFRHPQRSLKYEIKLKVICRQQHQQSYRQVSNVRNMLST